ncbi:hypothetical protein [Candidatus Clostridium radicumherbarum]|uniref:Spore coat protein n=1 Tax=Candidatus Clostridium radicumherbarum TaxID=3381662 RepID=A0ABW8TP49_9CLOT
MNNNEVAQDNSYNNPEYMDYGEYPCLDCPYLRQYPGYYNPMMYPTDEYPEYPAYDDMFRRRHHRRRRPFFPGGGFPWWWFFIL